MTQEPMSSSDALPVRIRFTGGALPLFGRVLLAAICTLLILPAAWGAVPLVRWCIAHLAWSDGSEASFDGQPGEIWYLFALAGLIGYVPILARQVAGDGLLVSIGGSLVTALLSALIAIPVWRWYVRHTRIGQTTDLTFDGDVKEYAALSILMQVSFYSVIGWAWVITALERWIMRHIRSADVQFAFEGSGLGVLWRTHRDLLRVGLALQQVQRLRHRHRRSAPRARRVVEDQPVRHPSARDITGGHRGVDDAVLERDRPEPVR